MWTATPLTETAVAQHQLEYTKNPRQNSNMAILHTKSSHTWWHEACKSLSISNKSFYRDENREQNLNYQKQESQGTDSQYEEHSAFLCPHNTNSMMQVTRIVLTNFEQLHKNMQVWPFKWGSVGTSKIWGSIDSSAWVSKIICCGN